MKELPHIPIVDSPNRFYQVVYEEDDKRRKDKVLAYLNQTGLIDYTQEKRCENDHLMSDDYKKKSKNRRLVVAVCTKRLSKNQEHQNWDIFFRK